MDLSLISLFGWVGAATTTMLSSALTLVLSYVVLDSILERVTIPFREIGFEIVASVVMVLVVLWMTSVVPRSRYATVGIVLLAAAVYTLVLLALSNRIRAKIRSLLPRRTELL